MQTQYKLLYRYVNEATNTVITDEAEYEKTEEFYNDSHKLYATTAYLNELNITPNMEFKYQIDGITNDEESSKLIKEENARKEGMIAQNIEDNTKSNNLYVYDGVKKSYHKKFIPEQLGYLVRDWTKIPKAQFPDGPDDYSKHFVMLNGSNPGIDDAILVCKPQYIEAYYTNYSDTTILNIESHPNTHYDPDCFINISTIDKNGRGCSTNITRYMKDIYLSYNQLEELINNNCMFEWVSLKGSNEAHYGESVISGKVLIGEEDHGEGRKVLVYKMVSSSRSGDRYTTSTKSYRYIYFDNEDYQRVPNSTDVSMITFTNSRGDSGSSSSENYTGYLLTNPNPNVENPRNFADKGIINYGYSFVIKKENVIRYLIPEHYEDTGKPSYLIKDQYRKIELSPWMFHSVHNSLEDGLEAAKTLIGMLGIDNVKLVKSVPINQFVHIK